jgi:hypothetical protein
MAAELPPKPISILKTRTSFITPTEDALVDQKVDNPWLILLQLQRRGYENIACLWPIELGKMRREGRIITVYRNGPIRCQGTGAASVVRDIMNGVSV